MKCPLVLIALCILLSAHAVQAAPYRGRSAVIDGDTIEIRGKRIRLWGIDAPESSQLCRNDASDQCKCGAKAANDLDAFIAGRAVCYRPSASGAEQNYKSKLLPKKALISLGLFCDLCFRQASTAGVNC